MPLTRLNAPSLYSLLLLLLTPALFHSVESAAFLGCYADHYHAFERDLSGALFLEETMTPAWCERQCGLYGYNYFGLQYGSECWCGSAFGRYGKVDDSRCSVACSGDEKVKCGGDLVNSVYQVTSATIAPRLGQHPQFDSNGRPLLGLVMIVKNENHTLPNTLQALKPYLDYWYILDTGSTDGTQNTIRHIFGSEVPGEVHEEPFKDYGTSRNRVLEIAQQQPDHKRPIYSLMLSADETVYNANSLRKFCEEHAFAATNADEAYPIQMDVGWRFDSVRLSRTDKGWRYVGRVHEYLAAPDQRWHPSVRVPNTYIKFKVTDPERRSNREYTILKILLEEKDAKPQDTRTSFYLARTYNVIGNHSAALDEFERRVALGGWQEEVYESLYAIAWQKKDLQRSWDEIQAAFLRAYEHSPERAEPLYSIAQHYYTNNQFTLCYVYAYHAATLPYPKQAVLWVQSAVYEWQSFFLVGMSALKFGTQDKYEIGAKALMLAEKKKPGDSAIVDQLKKYQALIPADRWAKIQYSVETHPHVLLPLISETASPSASGQTNFQQADGVARAAVAAAVNTEASVDPSQQSSTFSLSSLLLWLFVLLFLCGAAVVVLVSLRRSKKKGGLLGGVGSDKVV